MRRILAGVVALGLAGSLGGCGYAVSAGLRLQGGVERAAVRPFENFSSDPALGAEVGAALREELARRGALEREAGARAVIDGEVRSEAGAASMRGGVAMRVSIEVKARLRVDGRVVAERVVRRQADHLGGADALEGDGYRALALRRLAGEAARELLGAFQE